MKAGLHTTATNAPELSDRELVALACADDARAFELLAQRHYRATFAVALAVMGNRSDAEDVCHDALIRGFARIEDCRHPDRVAQWLCAIVRNHARNERVRPPVTRSRGLDDRLPSNETPPVRELERADLRVRLEQALAQLPAIEREIVLLSDLHDWPHDKIAEMLDTSPGMSRQHLFKARRRLRELLGADSIKEHFND